MELVHLLSRGISTELWSCSWKWQKTFVSGPQDKIWFFVNLLFPVSRMWNSIMNQFRVVVQFKHTRKLKLHIWFLDYVCRAVSLQNCPKAEYSIYIFQVLHKGWDKDFWGIIIFIKLEYYIYTVCYTFCLTSFKASYAIFFSASLCLYSWPLYSRILYLFLIHLIFRKPMCLFWPCYSVHT